MGIKLDGTTTPIVIAVLLQSLGGIWWAASITSEMRVLRQFADRAEISIRAIDETRFSSDDETKYRDEVSRRMFTIEEAVRELQTQMRRQQ